MICGFGVSFGEPSRTYTSDRYEDGMPAELVEIGQMMANEDYVAFGGKPRGYDHVTVSIQER